MSASHAISDLAPGFADPARDAQQAFRRTLDAISHPGRVVTLEGVSGRAGFGSAASAVALSLLDFDTPAFMSPSLAEAGLADWLRFHTGASVVHDHRGAAFVLLSGIADPDILDELAQGDPKYPDRSATVIAEVGALEGGELVSLQGPGIDGSVSLGIKGLGAAFWQAWERNTARFPLGVDVFLCADDRLVALPRTARLHQTQGS